MKRLLQETLLAVALLLPWALHAQNDSCDTTVPYTQTFESTAAGALPPCWLAVHSATMEDMTTPCVTTNPLNAHGGSRSLRLYDGTFEESTVWNTVATPRFADVSTLQVSFWAKTDPYMHPDLFVVGVVDPQNQFEPLDTIPLTESYTYHVVSLEEVTLSAARIAFYAVVANRASAAFNVYIDDITVDTRRQCQQPTQLRLLSTGVDQVTLAWEDQQAGEWEVCYGPSGFTPDSNSLMESGIYQTQATISGLTTNQNYDFYVRAVCTGETSLWWGPLAARPGVYLMPVTGTDTLRSCGTTLADDGGLNGPYSPNCNGILVLYPDQEGYTVRLTGTVSTYSDYSDYLDIFEGVGTTGRHLAHLGGESRTIDTLSNIGPLTLRFVSDNSLSSFLRPIYCTGFNLAVTCEELPPCPSVGSVTVSNITGTSALLSWVEVPVVLDYTVTLTDLLTHTTQSLLSTTGSLHVAGLSPNTLYEVSVEANCPNGDASAPVTLRFATSCLSGGVVEVGTHQAPDAMPVNAWWSHSLSQQILLESQLGGLVSHVSSLSFLNSTAISATRQVDVYLSTTSLSAFTSGADYQPVTAAQRYYSGPFTITANDWCTLTLDSLFPYSGGNLMVTVVDHTGDYLDNQPQFSITNTPGVYRALTSISYSDSEPCNLTSPQNISLQTHYNHLRLGTACDAFSGCLAPVPIVQQVRAHEVDLAWVPGYNESAWSIEYRLLGDPLWTTAAARHSTTDFTLTGLQASSDYELRLSSLCSGGDTACALLQVSTPCEPAALPFAQDFETFLCPQRQEGIEPCWTRHGTALYNFHPYRTGEQAFDGGASIYFHAADHPWLILPEMAAGLDSLVLRARVMSTHAQVSTNKVLVGVISNPQDLNTFHPVMEYTLPSVDNRWFLMEVELQNYTGPHGRLAITAGNPANDFYLDHLEVLRASTCRRVISPQVSAVTTSSATLSWVDTLAADDYTLFWGPTDDPAQATDSLRLTGSLSSHTLTSLRHSSRYYAWIRTNCPGEPSWLRPFEPFSTQCVNISQVPLNEGFESYSTGDLPTCWTPLHLYESYPSALTTAQAHGGASCLVLNSHARYNGGRNTVALPEIASLADLQLSFYAAPDPAQTPELLTVGILEANNAYLPIDTLPLPEGYARHVVYLNNYLGHSHRLAFQTLQTETGRQGRLYLDDLTLDSMASCPIPARIRCLGTTGREASLAWRENGQATLWQLAYSTSPLDDPSAGTLLSTAANPCTVTGLVPETRYYFYVRALCAPGDTSEWCGYPAEALTECDPSAQFPYVQDFEGTDLPDCWHLTYRHCEHPWQMRQQGAALAFPGTPSDSPCTAAHGGQYNIAFLHNFSTACRNTVTLLTSPLFDLTSLARPTLAFWHVQPQLNQSVDALRLYYRTAADEDWVLLDSFSSGLSSWTQEIYPLPRPSATYQLAFEAVDNYGYGIGLDDLRLFDSVETIPPCDPVARITLLDQGPHHLTLSWPAPPTDPAGYLLQYGPQGFALGTGTLLHTTDTTLTLSALDSVTLYDLYLLTLCRAGADSSLWAGPFTLATVMDCLTPEAPRLDDLQGTSATLSWVPASGERQWMVRLWSPVYQDSALVTSPLHTFTSLPSPVPFQASVRALCLPGVVESPWSDTLRFTTPDCPMPASLQVTALTATTASLQWEGDAPEYLVRYGLPGFGDNEYSGQLTVLAPECRLEGLDPDRTYAVRVQARCAPGWVSLFTEETLLTTLQSIDRPADGPTPLLRLHPNPARDYIIVETDFPPSPTPDATELQLIDLQGRIVLRKEVTTSNFTLPTSHLTPGPYFVKLGPAIQKLVVQ